MNIIKIFIISTLFFLVLINCGSKNYLIESKADRDARMEWWREARFGMFIHWGLYAIPAGEWKGETNHAEWIRTTAQIPLEEYDKFVQQFNPVKFNAEKWAQLAKDAGMKYIVITSKHHDGFCMFDTQYTDFDIMSTPFQRDILKELSDACHKAGIKMCWYHSIMDWHHPDYLPRRDWEKDRSTEEADMNRYVLHMKNQLRELVKNYGEIGVLWFDGEWENTWNQERGKDLYNYVRNLQPNIIINNRVGAGRSGMEGFTKGDEFAGDFGTPEQQIPATGLPGVDWETCMTMNDHWGYNKNDHNWKSATELIQMLADIASKGGNFLLNIGPTAEGLFPQPSIDRLRAIGNWMKVNDESIYGTQASPFKYLEWGCCTQQPIEGGTRLFLHVFDWPETGELIIPGIYNQANITYLLSDPEKNPLDVSRHEDALVIAIPATAPDSNNSVVVLDIEGKPDVSNPPDISSDFNIFVDELEVAISSDRDNVQIRYTLDGTIPQANSPLVEAPLRFTETTTVSARCFRDGKSVSASVQATFTKVSPKPSVQMDNFSQGIKYSYFEGDWDWLPDFDQLTPVKTGMLPNFNFSPRNQEEYFGFQYMGFIKIPKDGVYGFCTDSDDGSQLFIGDQLVVDNDGLHGMHEEEDAIALAVGFHLIRVTFFEKTGGDGLQVYWKGTGMEKQVVPDEILFIKK